MGEEFDVESVFGDDYLRFAGDRLDTEADAQAELLLAVAPIEPGAEVLDVGCGHGRIANRLAARGFAVTGLDLTPAFLERARADAQAMGVEVDYVEGDMRSLPWRHRFDVVVSWFTAFGYFDDDTNRAVLRGVHDALRPGGRLVMELNHRDELLARYLPATVDEIDGALRVERYRFDPLTGRSESVRTIVADGEVRSYRYFVRLLSFTELRDWLRAAGFAAVEGFGPDGAPLTIRSTRMIVVAHA